MNIDQSGAQGQAFGFGGEWGVAGAGAGGYAAGAGMGMGAGLDPAHAQAHAQQVFQASTLEQQQYAQQQQQPALHQQQSDYEQMQQFLSPRQVVPQLVFSTHDQMLLQQDGDGHAALQQQAFMASSPMAASSSHMVTASEGSMGPPSPSGASMTKSPHLGAMPTRKGSLRNSPRGRRATSPRSETGSEAFDTVRDTIIGKLFSYLEAEHRPPVLARWIDDVRFEVSSFTSLAALFGNTESAVSKTISSMYGFERDEQKRYMHTEGLFRRGRPELVSQIRRRTSRKVDTLLDMTRNVSKLNQLLEKTVKVDLLLSVIGEYGVPQTDLPLIRTLLGTFMRPKEAIISVADFNQFMNWLNIANMAQLKDLSAFVESLKLYLPLFRANLFLPNGELRPEIHGFISWPEVERRMANTQPGTFLLYMDASVGKEGLILVRRSMSSRGILSGFISCDPASGSFAILKSRSARGPVWIQGLQNFLGSFDFNLKYPCSRIAPTDAGTSLESMVRNDNSRLMESLMPK